MVDGPGDKYENILGTKCSFCGFVIEWQSIKCEEKGT
jgi:hypothetical protein